MLSKTIVKNTALLTLASVFMRAAGLVFQIWLSNRIGAEGLGMFQLVMSVNIFASTVALSGIRFAATRLIAEEIGKNNPGGAVKALTTCMVYAGVCGVLVLVILYFGADYIGRTVIGQAETVASLRILALSLPFFSLSAVLSGYFTAVQRVAKAAAVSVIEQLTRIGVIVLLLAAVEDGDIEHACASIVIGGLAGNAVSFVLHYILCLHDRRVHLRGGGEGKSITRRMFSISVPLAVSAYTRTALVSAQNLLIPRGLERSGLSGARALADYGTIDGMVFPVITFPSALFYALADTLMPELTAAQVAGKTGHIKSLVGELLRKCFAFSVGVTCVLFAFSGELGKVIYNSDDVGHYIRVLSLLMPFMYMDSVTDGMLRGLGQHLYSMKVNIADAVISLGLVVFLLPKYAVYGYVFILYFSELFNFFLSIRRLKRVSRFDLSLIPLLRPVIAALLSIVVTDLCTPPSDVTVVTLILRIIMMLSSYCLILMIITPIKNDRRFASVKKGMFIKIS
jgi:stage V sporulation protein B